MKSLKFRPDLVELVLTGKKTVTWRLFDDKNLKIGDELELINKETLEKFGNAIITNLREKKLGEIEASDYDGHETYESNDTMIETFKKYYGERVSSDTTVKVITFKLL